MRVTHDGSAVRARLEINSVGADSTAFNCEVYGLGQVNLMSFSASVSPV